MNKELDECKQSYHEKMENLVAQQAKEFQDIENKFREEIEKAQEVLKSQEKDFVREIDTARVRIQYF